MKNTKLKGVFVILILTMMFSTCSKAEAQTGGGKSVTSATALKEYLDSQPANSADKPIKVKMSINEQMMGNVAKVIKEAGKYVSLDLSGSPLTIIPDGTFSDCKLLAGIIIPNSVTTIGENAFSETSLTSVTIPNSVTHLSGFDGTGLTSVIIPNSVTTIGDSAFNNCTSLTSVIIPNSITSIGSFAFSNTSLTSINIPNGVTTIGQGAFNRNEKLTNITIPNSVTSIERVAFSDCEKLTSVIIPNSVTIIGDSAFRDSGLTSVIIPNGVTSIGGRAFYCTSLTSVTFQGTIKQGNFGNEGSPFVGDLRDKYLKGGIGTYTTTAPVDYKSIWTK